MSASVLQKRLGKRITNNDLPTPTVSIDAPIVGRTAWDVLGSVLARISKRPVFAVLVLLIVSGAVGCLVVFGKPNVSYGKDGIVVDFSKASAKIGAASLEKRITS